MSEIIKCSNCDSMEIIANRLLEYNIEIISPIRFNIKTKVLRFLGIKHRYTFTPSHIIISVVEDLKR